MGSQVHDPRPSVAGRSAPLHQLPLLQAIDRRRNRSARQFHHLTELVNGQRTFVEQHFEDAKVRQAHAQTASDVPLRKRGDRLKSAPQDQPQVNAVFSHLKLKILDIKRKFKAGAVVPTRNLPGTRLKYLRIRPSAVSAAVMIAVATGACLYASEASNLFSQGQKFEKSGEFTRAYLLYAEAAALDPGKTAYRLKAASLQLQAFRNAKVDVSAGETGAPDPAGPESQAIPEFTSINERELSKAREALPPAKLKLASGRFDFHIFADPKEIFNQTAQRCGLQTAFDGDFGQMPSAKIHFNMDDADCREALHAAESATGSFVVPLSSKLIFISKDIAAKRVDNEQTMSVVVPVPTVLSTQELTEIAQAVKQVTGVEKLAWSAASNEIVMRDRVSRVIPAKRLVEQLVAYRGSVMVDMRFLQVSNSEILALGVNLTNSFPITYLGDFLHAQSAQAATTTAAATAQAAIKLLGQGKTMFGIGALQASVVANLTNTSARTILRMQLRAVSGLPSTLHVGDKYPVLTAGYFGPPSASTGGTVYTPPPSFTFEDLGVSFKILPVVSNEGSITMDIDAEFKLLAGQSVDGIPIISNRKVSSRISLRNEEWAVVAGLMDSTDNKSTSGVAGLARIPLLGWLFRTQNWEKDRDHILIVMKPHLVGLPPSERTTPELRVGSETRPLSPI